MTAPDTGPPGAHHAPAIENILRRGDDPTLCWEWPKFKDKEGYGRTKLNGKTSIAHRAAWIIANGPIPSGASVLHKCDNPSCVNPNHLFLGTQKENIADCIAKNRFPKGERNGWAKINERVAADIRAASGTQVEIAAAFGISQSLVSAVRRGDKWRAAPR